jgi:hypothetical protein
LKLKRIKPKGLEPGGVIPLRITSARFISDAGSGREVKDFQSGV